MAKSYMLIRHLVQDFPTWKKVYDAHQQMRDQAGLRELYLLHRNENENEITLFFEVQNIEKAKAFVTSADTDAKMKESQVIGIPEIYFLNKSHDPE